MSRAFRLGITGKMGSGKSTLSEVARKNGIHVLEADIIAKEVMTKNPEVCEKIKSVFGQEAYQDEVLNRPYLASKIFHYESLRHQLEEIVHPVTLEVYEQEFAKALSGEIVALESAILFQTGLDEIFDAVVLIEASDADVVGRISNVGKFDKEDILNRLKHQDYQSDWKEDADFTVSNNGSLIEFTERCNALIQLIKIIANQDLPEQSLRSLDV